MSKPDIPLPDAAPAQALWVQLATRITTQPLHYRSGEEETAAKSIASLFDKVRELLEKYPQAEEFRKVSLSLLNDTLRSYTARWHGWMTEDWDRKHKDGKPLLRFRDEQVRRQFRAELKELRPQLCEVKEKLAKLGGFADIPDKPPKAVADLGEPLEAGIQEQVEFKIAGNAKLASPDDINAAERDAVLRRRLVLGTLQPADSPRLLAQLDAKSDGPKQAVPGAPATKPVVNDALGLALSGGGIRSATFCLGILQVLVRKGLLPEFDYLSTVSGGGYFGSFLSCALGTLRDGQAGASTREEADKRIRDVFDRREEESRRKGVESGLLRHLRNNSKYLLGGGFLGRMWIVGLALSGLLWNGMIMLPIPLYAALLAYAFAPFWGVAMQAGKSPLPSLCCTGIGGALMALAGLLTLCWLVLPLIERVNHGKPPESQGAMFRIAWERWTLCVGLVTALVALIYFVPVLLHLHEWLRLTLMHLPMVGQHLHRIAGLVPASTTGAAGAVFAALAHWLGPNWPRLRLVAVRLFILTGPVLFLLLFELIGNHLGLARHGDAPWNPYYVFAATVVLTIWGWLLVNINTLAPHEYYRNRLCECYLVRRIPENEGQAVPATPKPPGETVQDDVEMLKQVKFSKLGADPTAPYHLLNMTLNVPTSRNKELRGRASDFFMASRHFHGSPLTGYARTEELERTDPYFDLGTTMAVSGAAVGTSMGWQSMPHLRFLMTLFNVRLGYWLQNPGKPTQPRLLAGPGPTYLFREMLGWMDENCPYVNLSDGGHIENLAVYELLRRRCKFIVCVDAGHEPGMQCADLIRLQRYAEIDLRIRMYFDTSDLQIGPNGLSRAHAILVKIDYEPNPKKSEDGGGGSQLGWMLYLKLAMTGVEAAYVKDYKREKPEFPHESTGQQLYSEAQFEAYRALGECAMEGLFRDELVGKSPYVDEKARDRVRKWFQCLATNLLPDNDEAFNGNGVTTTASEAAGSYSGLPQAAAATVGR
jgi:predicted acylesterase/phospholipase RssA